MNFHTKLQFPLGAEGVQPMPASCSRAMCTRSKLDALQQLWSDEGGQDIAEYAVMLAVILVIVVGTIRLVGTQSNNVFSSVASAIQ